MRIFNEFRLDNLRGDLFGGVTAAIIALPMALAFGVASGAGPTAGLYGAVLVGLFAALFGSTSTLISEPTGPMTVVFTAVIAHLIAANPEQGMAMAFTVVMMAGALQVLFGALRLGQYVTLMPYTVISGFMTGIGLILIILQLAPFLGHATPGGGVIGSLNALPALFDDIKIPEASLAVLTLAILVLFPKKLARMLPPQLVALVVGTLIAIFVLGDSDIRRIGEIPTGLPDIQMPVFNMEQWGIMIVDATVLAVLGSIDALLTSVIAENMTSKEHNSNKELFGQGMGNIASGMFGGLPGAGATMGTVVNIQAGGRSALSGISRALILLVVVLWAAGLTANIPLAVLAGIAMKVGFDIIDWSFLRRAHRVSYKAALIMYGVIALTVFVDLITAVAIGVFIANLLTIDRMAKMQSEAMEAFQVHDPNSDELLQDPQEAVDQSDGQILVFSLCGPLMFGVAKAISRKHAVVKKHKILLMDFTGVPTIGVSSSLALEKIILEDLSKGKPVFIVGAVPAIQSRFERLGLLKQLNPEHIIGSRPEAISMAVSLLDSAKNQPASDIKTVQPRAGF